MFSANQNAEIVTCILLMGMKVRKKTSEGCSLMVKLKEATYYTGNQISANTIGKLVVYKNFFNVFVDHVIVP